MAKTRNLTTYAAIYAIALPAGVATAMAITATAFGCLVAAFGSQRTGNATFTDGFLAAWANPGALAIISTIWTAIAVRKLEQHARH